MQHVWGKIQMVGTFIEKKTTVELCHVAPKWLKIENVYFEHCVENDMIPEAVSPGLIIYLR